MRMAKFGLPLIAAAALCIIIASSAFAESFLSRLTNLRRPSSSGSKQQDQSSGQNHHHQRYKSIGAAGSVASWPQQATTSVPIETTTTKTEAAAATNRTGSNEQQRNDDLTASDTLSSSVFDELGGDEERQQRTTNGTAILEDLVNQFLEKNRDAVQEAAGEQTKRSSTRSEHQQPINEQSNYTFKTSSRRQKEAAGSESPDPIAVGSRHEAELAGLNAGSTSMPFMQLIALPTRSAAAFETGSGESSDTEDASYQELDDRHIQYDRPQVEPLEPAQLSGNAGVAIEANNSDNRLEKRLGQANAESAFASRSIGGLESGNYTLSIVRKYTYDGPSLPMNPIKQEMDSSSAGDLRIPLRATFTTTNQTGPKIDQEGTTITNSEPATQIKSPVSSKWSSSAWSKLEGDPIASAAFTTIARAATAIKSANSKPLIAGRSLPTRSASTPTTNETHLPVAALELTQSNATTTLTTSSRSVQARAMNSAGSGKQLPASGPTKTAHNSKPPYATNHEELHHRLGPVVVGAVPSSNKPPLGAEQQQTLEKRQDDEFLGQQPTKVSAANVSANTSKPNGSQDASTSIANTVNQISSHLNSISSREQQKREEAALQQREQGSLSLLEDRQLQKLAPASQLVELHPIPEQQHSPSDRFYFSKENQLFSLFPAPSTGHREGGAGGSKLGAPLAADETFPDYSAALFLEPQGSMLDMNNKQYISLDEQPAGDEPAQRNNASSHQQVGAATVDSRLATRTAAAQQAASSVTAITAAHESKNGAADLRLDHLAGSTAPASVQRKTLESVSNQLNGNNQQSSSVLSETPNQPAFVIDNAESSQQQSSTQLMQRTAPNASNAPFAASLINVTAPMVPPLSATEAMESALGDQAGKNILRQVSGFLRPTQSPASSISLAQQQIDHLLSSATTMHQQQVLAAGSAGGGLSFDKVAQIQRQNGNHQYFLPPTGALLEAQQQALAAQQQRQPIYSQPANQFSPRPHVESATAGSTSSTTTTTTAADANAADKERMRLDSANGSLSGSSQLSSGSSRAKGPMGVPYAVTNSSTGAAHQASGFRSPSSSSSVASLAAWLSAQQQQQMQASFPPSYLAGNNLSGSSQAPPMTTTVSGQQYGEPTITTASSSSSAPPYAQSGTSQAPPSSLQGSANSANSITTSVMHTTREPYFISTTSTSSTPTTNGFITTGSQTGAGGYGGGGSGSGSGDGNYNYNQDSNHSSANAGSIVQVTSSPMIQQQQLQHQLSTTQSSVSAAAAAATGQASTNNVGAPMNNGLNRRVFNLTRVEHISAECSNDLIRTVIVFNGTFKGIIYSSGYVRDPSCMYVNGTGKNKYEFSIRLNQCGTLGRQELHSPTGPNEIRRRDQVMWNTLSIQYNPIIEQEWDEHFRVSCEYGSDFWKTVSFNPFNVETNTGSPVVFTVDPPQCQMEILRGHGMVGPRQEQVSGPVTVGDPLTLLIHMKSEKAGYDILVKNCIAHNGGHQKMQLIDSNGCVVNERFISPFRGTYNDNDLKHVTLYSYLKAFRFTGSPVLYLECEIHMCQSSCPPQMCYWRRLSKRSAPNSTVVLGDDSTAIGFDGGDGGDQDAKDESPATSFLTKTTSVIRDENDNDFAASSSSSSTNSLKGEKGARRQARKLSQVESNPTKKPAEQKQQQQGQISDKVSLFQALEVRQEREPDAAPYSIGDLRGSEAGADNDDDDDDDYDETKTETTSAEGDLAGRNLEKNPRKKPRLFCYSRIEVLAFLITTASILLVALTVTIGCCWREASIRRRDKKRLLTAARVSNGNLRQCGGGTMSSYQSNSSTSSSGSSDGSSYLGGQRTTAYNSNKLTSSMLPNAASANILSSLQQHQQHSARLKERLLNY